MKGIRTVRAGERHVGQMVGGGWWWSAKRGRGETGALYAAWLRTFCAGPRRTEAEARSPQAAQPSSAERTLRQRISAAGVPTPALLKPTSSSALLRRLAALLSPRGLALGTAPAELGSSHILARSAPSVVSAHPPHAALLLGERTASRAAHLERCRRSTRDDAAALRRADLGSLSLLRAPLYPAARDGPAPLLRHPRPALLAAGQGQLLASHPA